MAAATILVSLVTANRHWGIVVPLTGWALLAADVAALAITFNT